MKSETPKLGDRPSMYTCNCERTICRVDRFCGKGTHAVCHAKHKFKKNHAKIIQKATIFQSPTQQAYPITLEILYYEKRQRNCFICNIIAQIPHSDNCQSSKMNKYSEGIECQSKHHYMTTKI